MRKIIGIILLIPFVLFGLFTMVVLIDALAQNIGWPVTIIMLIIIICGSTGWYLINEED